MNRKPEAVSDPARLAVLLAMAGLGASAVMTQLALMRELLGAFTGNELVFGIGLGSWLLLSGVGAAVGGLAGRLGSPGRYLAAGQILIAVLPPGQVLAIRAGRDFAFVHGAAVGPIGTVLGAAVVLFPYCIVSGAMLAAACHLLAGRDGARGTGRVYLADSLGGVAGGVLFSFVLMPWLDHFGLLCVPAAANLLLAALLARRFQSAGLCSAALAGLAGLAIVAAAADADSRSTAWQHPGQRTLLRANSPYGRLLVTEASGQLNFFENGVPLFSTGSTEQVEETVHYPMSQRPDARKVLLISGGITGTAREILRYGVREVTYVELDPAIVTAGRRFLPGALADSRIKVVMTDGRRFVQRTPQRFDVAIVAAADPSTSQLNRFYTAEFFAEVKRDLAPGGVLAIGLGHYENYVSPEFARMIASAHRTLGKSFAHILMIPGGRVYFLASDGPLDPDIAGCLERRGIGTQFVNRHYLTAMMAPDRRADLDRAAAQPAETNTDLSPVLYYYHLQHWFSQYPLHLGLLCAIPALFLAIYLATLSPVSGVIFVSGFSASILEVVLLIGFQCLYGSLYRQVGLLVTVFMAGLAAGAWLTANRLPLVGHRLPLSGLAVGIAGLAGLLPVVLGYLGRVESEMGTAGVGQGVILGLTLILAILVGAQFPMAVAALPGTGRAASVLYAADFVGASLGALLASTLLIPLFGATAVCLITAGLNLAAAALAWAGRTGPWESSTPSA